MCRRSVPSNPRFLSGHGVRRAESVSPSAFVLLWFGSQATINSAFRADDTPSQDPRLSVLCRFNERVGAELRLALNVLDFR